jgi:hypothetical protein
MLRPLPNLPHRSVDLVLTVVALLLALAAGRAVLLTPSIHDSWLDVFFLGSVTLFLVEIARFIVRTFDIDEEVDELQTAN